MSLAGRRRLSRTLLMAALACVGTAGLAALPACLLGYEEGARLDVTVQASLGAAVDAQGVEVQLVRAWLHVGAVRLVLCAGEAEGRSPSIPSPWRGAPLSRAYAHHTRADGRALAGGHVLDLSGADVTLGTLRPPPQRYCALEMLVAEPEPESLGDRAALGDDTIRVEALRAGEPWSARSAGSTLLELPLEPWTPGADAAGELTVALELPATLSRVDTAEADPFDRGLDLLREMSAHATRESSTD